MRLIDEIDFSKAEPKLSDAAKYIRDRQIHLEMAPTSNLQTGAAKDYATHPAALLHELGFNLSLNTDNRLMSNTSLSREYAQMSEIHGWDQSTIETMNRRAREAAFH